MNSRRLEAYIPLRDLMRHNHEERVQSYLRQLNEEEAEKIKQLKNSNKASNSVAVHNVEAVTERSKQGSISMLTKRSEEPSGGMMMTTGGKMQNKFLTVKTEDRVQPDHPSATAGKAVTTRVSSTTGETSSILPDIKKSNNYQSGVTSIEIA